jgi:hypothetical protein
MRRMRIICIAKEAGEGNDKEKEKGPSEWRIQNAESTEPHSKN